MAICSWYSPVPTDQTQFRAKCIPNCIPMFHKIAVAVEGFRSEKSSSFGEVLVRCARVVPPFFTGPILLSEVFMTQGLHTLLCLVLSVISRALNSNPNFPISILYCKSAEFGSPLPFPICAEVHLSKREKRSTHFRRWREDGLAPTFLYPRGKLYFCLN